MQKRRDILPLTAFGIAMVVFIWSAISPHDRFTWILEVFPAVIAALILIPTYRRFRFSDLAYVLIAVHAMILMLGGKYTYAEVPLGFWMEKV